MRGMGVFFPDLPADAMWMQYFPVIEMALKEANLSPSDIDLISVAKGPGLIGALLIGLNTAKALSLAWGIPYVGVVIMWKRTSMRL